MTYRVTVNAFWQRFRKLARAQRVFLDKLVVDVVEKLSYLLTSLLHGAESFLRS